jgi:xylulokinase
MAGSVFMWAWRRVGGRTILRAAIDFGRKGAPLGRYLGLDSSTQSLSAIVIDSDTGQVVVERSLNFGQRLPAYRCPSGFLPAEDPKVKQSDPLMWVDALELLFGELKSSGLDLSQIRGISGAGQQHGSVYLGRSMATVGRWTQGASLVDQVRPLLSRAVAPIWMDSSTSEQCAEITSAAGGEQRVVTITGSRAIERFTAAQIRKFAQTEPKAWDATVEVHLVSSFMASMLVATTTGIDLGDGAGMNLLDLAAGDWSPVMVRATAPGLEQKLPRAVPSSSQVGLLADYFVSKYGFAPKTPVYAFTGDNPSSLVGMGASRPGTMVISLGTSDTVFAAMSQPRTDPRGYGHVFGNPAGGFMSLICFSNGSLAREEIARRFGMSWEAFASAVLEGTRPGNDGNMMLPYFAPEITPRLLHPEPRWFGSPDFTEGRDAARAARAIVEAQALGMRLYSSWIGEKPETVLVTGGASRNRGILRVLADVLQAEIRPLTVANSSALGGALRAAQATEKMPWADLFAQFAATDPQLRVGPDPSTQVIYQELGAQFERRVEELLAAQ